MYNLAQSLKTSFWKYYLPFHLKLIPYHPQLRNFFQRIGLINHGGRQPYLLGHLKDITQIEKLRDFLITQKFESRFPAWLDEGEIFGMRYRESFDFQYHIRFFKDGEVRGHYEITAESKPIAHLRDTFTEPKTGQFKIWLQDWVNFDSGNTNSQSAPAASLTAPE